MIKIPFGQKSQTPPPGVGFLRKSLKNQRGLSLVELLVTTGLASIVLTGTFKLIDISTQSSKVVKATSAEQDLRYTVKDVVLLQPDQCKHNLSASGISKTTGTGTLTQLTTKDTNKVLVQTGAANAFKGDLEVVKMELSKDGNDPADTAVKKAPNKNPVDRTFTVYYKKAGLGNLSTLGGQTCTSADTTGCYFVYCDLKYQIDSGGTNVETCQALNCGGSGGVLAGSVNCYTVDPDDTSTTSGRTLIGCGGASDVSTNQATVLGYGAGTSGQKGVAIGYNAGKSINSSKSPGVYIGNQAGEFASNAGYNESSIMIGSRAGQQATGNEIVALGRNACQKAGKGNICIGYKTGQFISGTQNVLIGPRAGFKNNITTDVTGTQNVMIGSNAGSHNKTGYENVFVGKGAGQHNSIGYRNVFIGKEAGHYNIGRAYKAADSSNPAAVSAGGFSNTFVGWHAGHSNTHGQSNTFIGSQAGKSNTEGTVNTFVGNNAGEQNTTGYSNIFIGEAAGLRNKTGSNNIVVGVYSGLHFTASVRNVFVGNNAGEFVTTASQNTIMGDAAGHNLTTGGANVLIGRLAGYCSIPASENTDATKRTYRTQQCTGHNNVFVGLSSGQHNSKGRDNVFIGKGAGYKNKIGTENVFIGADAGKNNIGRDDDTSTNTNEWSGHANVFIGKGAGATQTYGHENVFVGTYAGGGNTESRRNTFIGHTAGSGNTTGSSNTMMGALSGQGAGTGDSNAFYGYLTGWKNKGAHQNTYIGTLAGARSQPSGPGNTLTTSAANNTLVGFASGGFTGDGGNATEIVKATYNSSKGKWVAGDEEFDKEGEENPANEAKKDITVRRWTKNQGANNTFIGSETGEANTTGNNNFFGGFRAGRKNTSGRFNIFIGSEAGIENTTGESNIFIGNHAGLKNTAASKDDVSNNTYVGAGAGGWNKGKSNTYVGTMAGGYNQQTPYQARPANKANENVIIGANAGVKTTTGSQNVFVGQAAGQSVTTGVENTYVGHRAGGKCTGNSTGNKNVFVGKDAGLICTQGDRNIFIGYKVGPNSTLSQSAFGLSPTADDQLNIGNVIAGKTSNTGPTSPTLAHLGTEGGIIVNGDICLTGSIKKGSTTGCGSYDFTASLPDSQNTRLFAFLSSREYKRNIQSFTDYDRSLRDIASTPLFTYEYKEGEDPHPEKTRWGIISEELPEHLQIKEEGKPSLPDWPSVYGTFWGALKALMGKVKSLGAEVKNLDIKLKKLWTQLGQVKERVQAGFHEMKKQIQAGFHQVKEQMQGFDQRLEKLEKQLQEERQARQALELQLKELQSNK